MAYNFISWMFLIVNILLFAFAYRSFKKKTRSGFLLGHTLLCCALILWSYTLNFYLSNETAMSVLCSIEHVFILWALYFLTQYVFDADGRSLRVGYKSVSIGLLLIDSAILLTNPINHFAADYTAVGKRNYVYFEIKPNIFFAFHCALCTFMLVTMFLVMARKIKVSPSYYKMRYFIIMGLLTIMILATIFYEVVSKETYDLSRFLYGICALFFYFATFDFTPYRLVNKLQKFTDDNITDATAIYDISGKALRSNRQMKLLFEKEVYRNKEKLKLAIGGELKEGHTTHTIGDKVYDVLYKTEYDKNGIFVASVVILYDITNESLMLEREHKAAITDPLTGCYNRAGFVEKAPEFREKYAKEGLVVIVSGISEFKAINGMYGSMVGDHVLIEIANRLREYSESVPMVYGRTAEGKFSCILAKKDMDGLIDKLNVFYIKTGINVEVRAEMKHGFAVVKDAEHNVEYFYEEALLALAKCRDHVQEHIIEYSEEMAEEQKRRQILLSAMYDAIERKEFIIEYQPQIDLKENRMVGAEALVRWNHPTLGRISPAEFIPLFEGNGFVTKLDKYVWDETAVLLKRLEDSNLYDGPISVNVSQVDIMATDVAADFIEIVKRHGIEPSKLHVEITESACAKNREQLISTLNKLRKNGFIVEIDDFGSGYSSLNALTDIPFDVVKLDMVFMRNTKGEKRDIVMKAIAKMIHGLKAEVIVEGIETEENKDHAIDLESDVGQGYYYSKPISLEKFIDYIRSF